MKAFLFAVLLASAAALTLQVDAKRRECFFEPLVAGQSVKLFWEVLKGGKLDLEIEITTPGGQVLYKQLFFQSGTEGQFVFATQEHGAYSFCFINEMSRFTPKLFSFRVEIDGKLSTDVLGFEGKGAPRPEGIAAGLIVEEDLQATLSYVQAIEKILNDIKTEQSLMKHREARHRDLAENINSRVMWWSVAESAIIVGMSVGQVVFLRRWFRTPSGAGI